LEGERMPTYDYECIKCGYTFEAFQSIKEAPYKVCSRCKGELRRLIGAGSGLIFKGKGFYITDYKRNNSSGKNNVKKDKKESSPASDSNKKISSSDKSSSGAKKEDKKSD
jgi:putative FmdB family regulatory protein